MVGRKFYLLFLLALIIQSSHAQLTPNFRYRKFSDRTVLKEVAAPGQMAEIYWPVKEQDLGYIKVGTTVSHNFFFTNIGKADLVIEKIDTEDQLTYKYSSPRAVKSGERGVITMQIIANRKGPFKAYFTITSNAKGFVHVLILTGVAY